jgi:hypothetical protein
VSKRPSKITVPPRANPLAKLVFAEMGKQGVTYSEIEHRSGVLASSLKSWRLEKNPGLTTIEATLGALGWALVPVPRMERLPQYIVDGLNALNERWSRDEPLLHHLLASACLAPILIDGAGPPITIDATPSRVTVRRKVRDPIPGQVLLFSETVQ